MTGERGRDVLAELASLSPVNRARLLRTLPVCARAEIAWRWRGFAHEGQEEPPGDWRIWLIRAGRGFGKTRAGSEWVSALARARPDARIALVGATADDVRRVMVGGASGLLAVARDDEQLRWRDGLGELTFPSGARAFCYSAEAPEGLRGPEHHAAWCDELAKWRRGDETWDNLQMGLRLSVTRQTFLAGNAASVPLIEVREA